MRAAVLTISDRSAAGKREDRSGDLLAKFVLGQGWDLISREIVPDEIGEIKEVLETWADEGRVDLILTTGGTGFAPRDVTPEATRAVVEREVPGIPEALRQEGLKNTPHAMLSRSVAGIRGRCLIINLPGSPKAVKESLPILLPVLPHAIELLKDLPDTSISHHLPPESRVI